MISPSDPLAAWTAKANKRVLFGYGLNDLIDVENAVIMYVEATPARTYDEVAATKVMVTRTEERFALKQARLIADTAYGTGDFLGWLVNEKKILPHIPVWDKSARGDGTFSRVDSMFDEERNCYICPTDKDLTTTGRVSKRGRVLHVGSLSDCRACPLKPQCCLNVPNRRVSRDVNEGARELARREMETEALEESRDLRKKAEMRFGHLKTHHGFERLRLRGLTGARDEFLLAAIVQNLKTLATKLLPPIPKPATP